MQHTSLRIWLAPVLIILVGALGWRFWPWRTVTPPHEIRSSGTIEATEVLISPKISGRLCALKVDEGSVVHAGDLIAQLETEEQDAQANAAHAALEHATAQWEAAHNGNRPEQIAQARAQLAQAQATVAGAYAALLNAREDYHKVTALKEQVDAAKTHYDAMVAARIQTQEALHLTQEGTRSQQIEQARAAVEQAQVVLDHDQKDYGRMETLFKEGAISRQQWDAAVAQRNASHALLAQAQAHLADLVAGARPQEIREASMAVLQADANVEGARLELKNAQEAFNDRLDARARYDAAAANYQATQAQERAAKAGLDLLLAGTRSEDLRAAQEAVRQARANLDYAQTQIANARITAPIDGVINTKVNDCCLKTAACPRDGKHFPIPGLRG